jgi:UDP-N-acetylmuramate--alanine ligase
MTIARTLVMPPAPAHIHIVGIGGIGLSGLAQVLTTLGYRVTGSDAHESDRTAALTSAGIAVNIGHTDFASARSADLVVSTLAVLLANPAELEVAAAAGVPIVKRGEVLAMLANARTCVAVAGSHGKSTTSGMLVTALRALGDDPSYAVGAVLSSTGTNAELARGPAMVVEADEFDRAFLWLTPDVAIVTTVEYDHPDVFPTQSDYDQAFVEFAEQVRPGGTLILAADEPGCRRLRESLGSFERRRIVTFGETTDADWRLAQRDTAWIVETPGGERVTLSLLVPGRHNARNATAALAALISLGHEPNAAARALETFAGVGRRFELKGEANGITVIDDYAHHPTEIVATLQAARERFPGRQIWAVFQPHTFSRTKALLDDFSRSFEGADRVMILDIYAARETDNLGISSADLRNRVGAGVLAADGVTSAVDQLIEQTRPGDVVVILGAGDVTHVAPGLLERLRGAADD